MIAIDDADTAEMEFLRQTWIGSLKVLDREALLNS
jgi:hypothetical protein